MARDKDVDISEIRGTGSEGRVTRADVEKYLQAQDKLDRTAEQPQALADVQNEVSAMPPSGDRPEERIRMSRRRRTIAQRLLEAKNSTAMLTTFNEVDMTNVMNLRKRTHDQFVERHGIKLGIVSFFVKAAIGALKDFPYLNAEIQGDEIVLKHYYDIGMAIGAEEGLVVPVIRDADRLSFAEIEKYVKELVIKSQSGKLSIDDLRGGSFTITNGGVFGSLLSTPILNPPQVGILGLHKIEERPVARERTGGHTSDDVYRPELRPPHRGWAGSSAVPGEGEGIDRGPGIVFAGELENSSYDTAAVVLPLFFHWYYHSASSATAGRTLIPRYSKIPPSVNRRRFPRISLTSSRVHGPVIVTVFESPLFCLLLDQLADRNVSGKRFLDELGALGIADQWVQRGHDNGILRKPAFCFFPVGSQSLARRAR